MSYNIWVPFLAALVPLILGSVYYNPKLLGSMWISSTGKTEEELSSGNMIMIFILTYILSLFTCGVLIPLTIHQNGFMSMLVMDPEFETVGSQINTMYTEVMNLYGDNHRTFKHGALHGAFLGILVVLPVVAIIGMFENRTWKNTFVHVVFWTICFTIMGGIVCAWV